MLCQWIGTCSQVAAIINHYPLSKCYARENFKFIPFFILSIIVSMPLVLFPKVTQIWLLRMSWQRNEAQKPITNLWNYTFWLHPALRCKTSNATMIKLHMAVPLLQAESMLKNRFTNLYWVQSSSFKEANKTFFVTPQSAFTFSKLTIGTLERWLDRKESFWIQFS